MHDETPHGLTLARRTIAAWQADAAQSLRARQTRENLRTGQIYRRALARLTVAILAPLACIAYVYLVAFSLLIIGGTP